jgi:hypothetical protein
VISINWSVVKFRTSIVKDGAIVKNKQKYLIVHFTLGDIMRAVTESRMLNMKKNRVSNYSTVIM